MQGFRALGITKSDRGVSVATLASRTAVDKGVLFVSVPRCANSAAAIATTVAAEVEP